MQRWLYGIATTLIIVLFIISDFGVAKINSSNSNYTSFDYSKHLELAHKVSKHGTSLGRLAGLQYAIDKTVHNSPIIGFVGMDRKGFDKDMAITLGIPSSIAMIIYSFGFLGLTLIIYSLFISSRKLSMIELGIRQPYMIFIVIIIYFFSFPFVSTVLFFYLVLYNFKS